MKDLIAVTGIGALFPDAINLSEYWSNIIDRKDSIKDISSDFWKLEDFYDIDPSAKDKTYSYKAGVVSSVDFDSVEFGIPPKVMESIAVDQIFALVVAKQALTDACVIGEKSCPVNRDKVGVILGAGIGKTAFSLSQRLQVPKIRKILINSGVPEKMTDRIISRIQDSEVEWSEASNPGYLANVVAGRISNRFDFTGTNCTVDAACGSSLAALKYSIHELQSRDCDIVLTGGVNLDCSPFSFVSFSKTPAISKSSICRPFDNNSDGMILGDGVGMVVLKRLSDAERDGDRIYAVIRSVGSSGDGKAKSIFAPSKEGQISALERAYENAEIEPKSIGLIEAHGTGTSVGDACEVDSLISFFNSNQAAGESIALGSVKSQIGHTRLSAGIAGMIKTIMALHHKVLPPMINVTSPLPVLEGSPFYVINKARPWIVNQNNPVRRAAVSAFGFGGTNFHVVLEEYQKEQTERYRIQNVPTEIVLFANSKTELIQVCLNSVEKIKEGGRAALISLSQIGTSIPENAHRVGFVASDTDEACSILEKAASLLESDDREKWIYHSQGIYYRCKAVGVDSKVVALFPGQGSQYVDMFNELAINYPEMRKMFEIVDDELIRSNNPSISSIVYPVSIYDKKRQDEYKSKLNDTHFTQPALAAVCGGLYRVLCNRGFKADIFLGHSFGELTSLWAAGAIDDELFARLSVLRGSLMSGEQQDGTDNGAMLAIQKDLNTVKELISNFDSVYIANENSDSQIVISGSSSQIDELSNVLNEKGISNKKLKVSGAFHSPFMKKPQEAYSKIVLSNQFSNITNTVYCNATAKQYPYKAEPIKKIFANQITQPVLFKTAIENAYSDGGRIFVEIGPKKVLSSLVEQILGTDECEIVSINPLQSEKSELQFRQAMVRLKVLGFNLKDDLYQKPNIKINKEKSKSSQTVKPTLFFTQEKDQIIKKATDTVDIIDPVTVQVKEPVAKCFNGGGEDVMYKDKSKIEDVNNRTIMKSEQENNVDSYNPFQTIYNIQTLNSSVFQQFVKNQQTQLDVLKEISKDQTSTLESLKGSPMLSDAMSVAKRYIDISESLQINSINAYKMFFSEQGRLLDHLTNGFTQPSVEQSTFYPEKMPQIQQLEPFNRISIDFIEQEKEKVNEKAKYSEKEILPVAVIENKVEPKKPIMQKSNYIDYSKLVFSVISEKTGYPDDMLDMDMELETDLGIDSIKRVEIFSALSNRISIGFAQEDVEKLSGSATIRQIADYLGKRDNGDAIEDEVACIQETTVLYDEELKTIFLKIISEKTGYPDDILNLDMDMETDLGIDSIKRVEIFSALSNQIPGGFVQDDVETLTTFSTLQMVMDFFASKRENVQERTIKRFEVEKKDISEGLKKNEF